jgi:hypothetical protein
MTSPDLKAMLGCRAVAELVPNYLPGWWKHRLSIHGAPGTWFPVTAGPAGVRAGTTGSRS